MDQEPVFILVPESSEAERIVKSDKNSRYHKTFGDTKSLAFKLDHMSCFPGRFLSIGSLDAGVNDVILPVVGAFAQTQCFFLITPSGELMLEDATTGHHTYVDCTTTERGKWADARYSLQGDPRRRVVPMDPDLKIRIWFGKKVAFRFRWLSNLQSPEKVDEFRARLSKAPAAVTNATKGVLLAVPRNPHLEPTAYEKRTQYTPNVAPELDGQPLRQVHVYKRLGKGAFGSVYKAVDLATGSLWAVKHCTNPKRRDDGSEKWKRDLKNEVEKLAKLQHPNIIRIEHHQGWSVEKDVQIFFPVCDGNLRNLLPRHHQCNAAPKAILSSPDIGNFIDQILSGLAFIHKQGVIHMDIKPDNLLFTLRSVGQNETRHTWFISDLGLTRSLNSAGGPTGTVIYESPEGSRYDRCTIASDVYSFGIVLLEILGLWCPDETDFNALAWQEKLRALGVKNWRQYQDRFPPNCRDSGQQPTHSRIKSLVDHGIVCPAVGRVLDEDPRHRSTADEARIDLLRIYSPTGDAGGVPKSPGIKRQGVDWGEILRGLGLKREPTGREQEPKRRGLRQQFSSGWEEQPKHPKAKRRPSGWSNGPKDPGPPRRQSDWGKRPNSAGLGRPPSRPGKEPRSPGHSRLPSQSGCCHSPPSSKWPGQPGLRRGLTVNWDSLLGSFSPLRGRERVVFYEDDYESGSCPSSCSSCEYRSG